MSATLRFALRTPGELVLDEPALAVRVPTETGLVGLRPRGEPLLLAVEPGLVLVRLAEGERFAATAGGLLESDRERAELLSPFAVAGADPREVLAELERALARGEGDLAPRRRIGELERRIIVELRTRGPDRHPEILGG